MSLANLPGVANRHPRLVIWSIAFGLGAAVFFVWMGFARTLDPSDLTWIGHEDPLTHLIGWEQFRNAPLVQYPITKTGLYGLELSSNVVFSDSIPIVAVLLRPLSGLLPRPFQYLGWWVLLSCVMQAYWSIRLLLLRSDRLRDAVIGSVFFVTTPVLLERLGGQTAVGSHWLVLWALWLYLNGRGAQLGAWAALLMLTVCVHAYLFVMVGAIWAAHLVACWMRREMTRREVALAAATGLGVVAWMHVLGYFMIGEGAAAAAWRSNCDVLAFLTPSSGARQRWLPMIYNDPWDGSMYLGAGIVVLLVASTLAWLVAGRRRERATPPAPRTVPPWTPLLVAVLGLALFAITNDVKVLDHHVVTLPFPRVLDRLYEMFRGAARMMWPAYYLAMLTTLWFASRAWPARAVSAVIACAALLQGFDVIPEATIKRNELNAGSIVKEPVDPIWNVLAAHYARIVSVPPRNRQIGWPMFAWFAARHHMGTNIGYLSRIDPKVQAAAVQGYIQSVATGVFDPETVYYLPSPALWGVARSTMGPQDLAIVADGFQLIVPGGRRWTAAPSSSPPTEPVWNDQWLLFNHPDTAGVLFSGWSWGESWGTWSLGRRARVVLPVPPHQRIRVSFRWFSPSNGRRARLQLGTQAAEVTFPVRDQEVRSSFEVETTSSLLDVQIEIPEVVVRPNNQRTVGIGIVAARVQLANEASNDRTP